MKIQTLLNSGAMALLATASISMAQTVTFEAIPNALSADDMSPDGRFIVGFADLTGNGFPDGTYRLDTVLDEFLLLPPEASGAVAVSDDGSKILGSMFLDGDGPEVAALWTESTGWVSLGWLPDANACPSLSNGYELSGDGSVAVGLSWNGCSGRGFIWSEATGMQELESLANGGNRASVVSADGSVVGGFAQGSFDRTPAMWLSTGDGELLDSPAGDAIGEVFGISDDGTILLGSWDSAAVMWVNGGSEQILGAGSLLPGWIGHAMDIADDGTVVGFDFLVGNRRAWIQPQGEGPLRLTSLYITAHGGVIPSGTNVEVLQAITADGRMMIGHSFGTGAFIVRVTPDCLEDVDGSGIVDVDDLVAVILAWGTADQSADVDGSGNVDVDDLVAVILAWGSC